MSLSFIHDPASEALLSAARERSPAEEQKCHLLLDLMDSCHAFRQMLCRELARNDLTETGFRVLAVIVGGGRAAITPAHVAQAVGLPRPAVASILGRLEISGLIVHERTSEERRVSAVRVTPTGQRAFSAALTHYRQLVTRVMSSLDKNAIATLDSVCVHLRQLSIQAAR